MLRAIASIARRGNLSLLPKSSKTFAHSKLRSSLEYSRHVVRFASNDKIKGSVADNPSGMSDNIALSKGLGSEPTACAQAQTAALGSDSDFGKQADKKHTQSEEHDSSAKLKSHSTKAESGKESIGKTESASKLSDDTMKQLQAVAANLPSKDQVEKFVFRVLAFIYDIVYLMSNWTIRFVNEQIFQNNTVKYYWKRFHEKMQEAKKD